MLQYLSTPPPEVGTARRVAEGVYWTRLPLPKPLGHINAWLLRDGDGWAVVDTGFHTAANAAGWRAFLNAFMGGIRVTRIFATHMHMDHVGMAGWISRDQNCKLWMTRSEYLSYRLAFTQSDLPKPLDVAAFYRQAG